MFGRRDSVGSDCWKQLSHRLRSQYQPAMLSSAQSQPIPLRHRPSITPLYDNSQNYRSVHCNLCAYSLLANGKASDSDFIEHITLRFVSLSKQCVTNPPNTTIFMAMTTCFVLHRPSSGHYYKNFPNKVKTQCSYNSQCWIPHVLQ